MKDLKSLKESLLSRNQGGRELTKSQREMIKGGYYTSEEECKAECNGSGGGWGSWSHKDYCVRGSDGYWTCYDS